MVSSLFVLLGTSLMSWWRWSSITETTKNVFFLKVGKYVVSSFVFLAFLGISGSQWKEWGGEGSIVMPQPSAVALTHNPFRPRKKNRFQHATNDTERKKERKKEKEQKERPRDRVKRTDAALSLRVDNLVGCPVIKVVIVRFAYLLSLSLSLLCSLSFPSSSSSSSSSSVAFTVCCCCCCCSNNPSRNHWTRLLTLSLSLCSALFLSLRLLLLLLLLRSHLPFVVVVVVVPITQVAIVGLAYLLSLSSHSFFPLFLSLLFFFSVGRFFCLRWLVSLLLLLLLLFLISTRFSLFFGGGLFFFLFFFFSFFFGDAKRWWSKRRRGNYCSG